MHLPAVAGMPPFPGVLRSSAALWTLGSPAPVVLSLSSSRIEQGEVGRRGLKSHCGAFSFYFPLFQNLDSILEYFLNGSSYPFLSGYFGFLPPERLHFLFGVYSAT